MIKFLSNIKWMIITRKDRQTGTEYHWFKYLVVCDIQRFFNRFKFWKKEDKIIPF